MFNHDFLTVSNPIVMPPPCNMDELQEQPSLMQLIAENVVDFLSVENGRHEYVYVSPSVSHLFGWRPQDLHGKTVQTLHHSDDTDHVTAERGRLVVGEMPSASYRYRLQCPGGDYRWVESRSRRSDASSYVITVTRDIHDYVLRLQQLEQLASHDALTNLFNRRAIMNALHEAFSRCVRGAEPLAVTLFDVDAFKKINDTLGHLAGDALLQSLASCIDRNKRRHDVLGRWGGDEFLLLMPDTTSSQAIEVVNRLRNIVAVELPAVGLSFGISCRSGAGSVEELLQQADAMLYSGKRVGGKQVMVWNA